MKKNGITDCDPFQIGCVFGAFLVGEWWGNGGEKEDYSEFNLIAILLWQRGRVEGYFIWAGWRGERQLPPPESANKQKVQLGNQNYDRN
ncbi:hypothetical protein KUW19_00635 [Ferrimonas balearica]|uniref:hypothetical protein n=1 Tax=Ferrimonas balearica TaxID=44012 RepID=UPI001C97D534|nr:hypothetical protein [Ferrimonas balearica]MBY6104982.1 hypothetical protein [Ferrimonas balearica]